MKTTAYSRQGNVLFTTLLLLLGVAALVGVSLNVTTNTARLTSRSRDVAKAEAAAEGALEYAYALWLGKIRGAPITTAEANADLVLPQFEGVSYASSGPQLRIDALDEYGVPMTSGTLPPRVTGRVPGYEGWAGQTFTYVAQARMQVDNNTVIGVKRLFQYTEVPLFQSMFFFQHDLEFYRPATMVLNGLVHSNSNMYFAFDKDSMTIGDNVTYSGEFLGESPSAKYWPDGYQKPPWAGYDPKWVTSKASQLHKVPAIQPMGSAPEKVFDTTDNNPNNDGFRELIEPPNPNHPDPEAISTRRMINKAGIVITITGTSSVTVTGQKGTTLNPTAVSNIGSAISRVVTTSTNKSGVVTVTALGLYDRRESKQVEVYDVDIAKLKTALAVGSGVSNFNNVLYIHDTLNSNMPTTIRLKNGSVLPDAGLTVASQNPVYIWGDYNTGGTGSNVPTNSGTSSTAAPTAGTYERKPSAVIGDAVMFLSNNWTDAKSATDTLRTTPSNLDARVASNTTYNTAIISGFMPSTNNSYSGGANNFPRFLEKWGSARCTYYGSMVELFESKTFTGKWNTGDIYSPPTRWWNFDKKFLQRPPPGSVDAIVLSRGPWSRF